MDPSAFIVEREAAVARIEQRRNELEYERHHHGLVFMGLPAGPLLSWLLGTAAGEVAIPIVREVAFTGIARLLSGLASRLLPRRLSKHLTSYAEN